MAKKNDQIKKIKSAFTIFEIVVAVATVAVGILNVWTAAKLAPLAQRIEVIATEVKANEQMDEKDHPTFVTKDAFLGTNLITAAAGSGGTGALDATGGAGSVGRIALHYSGTYSGSTNPTLYANQDTTLVESAGGIFFHNFL